AGDDAGPRVGKPTASSSPVERGPSSPRPSFHFVWGPSQRDDGAAATTLKSSNTTLNPSFPTATSPTVPVGYTPGESPGTSTPAVSCTVPTWLPFTNIVSVTG